MSDTTLSLAALNSAVAHLLEARDGTDTFPHVYRASERSVARLGFALEPDPGLADWTVRNRLDALFVHRPWRLDVETMPEDLGVVAYHQPLDATLAVGYNRYLATDLGLQDLTPLGEKDGAPLGMIGDVAAASWDDWEARVRQEFKGVERVSAPHEPTVKRVAVMGAMNDALVRTAYQAGADVYITGQMRVPGQDAVRDTGIGVVAVGHARGERWGLRKLAALLRQQYPALFTVVR